MPQYDQLPQEALSICSTVSAPARLKAHLVLVHDVATKLVAKLHRAFPELRIEDEDVFFGAATHDIGKAVHPEELSHAGHLHELEGYELMRKLGVPERRARFSISHGSWDADSAIELDDLLVALADKCWKGERVSELESKVVREVATQTGKADWEVFSLLDEILQELSNDADERLAWQAQFSVG